MCRYSSDSERGPEGSRHLGGAPATAAGSEHPADVAGLQLDGALVGEAFGAGLITAGQQPILPYRTRLSAPQAPRPGDSAFGDEGDGAVL